MNDPRFIRQPEIAEPEKPKGETVDLGDDEAVKIKPDAIIVDLPDGKISINLGGLGALPPPDDAKSDHDANLAMYVDGGTLGAISDELIRLISDDITRQQQRLDDVVKGLELLGVKLEEPRTEPNSEGISVIRHPLLLEAVLRFQANARGELLPADGPVKVKNEGDDVEALNVQAQQLEDDFNHYLTSGAPEYYPDFDRMLFSLGHGGEAYKKVYWHPLKRRPVSETIDRKDIILSDGAVSLEACARITHRCKMRPSVVKQMQLAGAWRDVSLSSGVLMPDMNVVDRKLDDLTGILPKMNLTMDDTDREIYECYCELDLQGFEHEEEGEQTGLPLPYRVTIDKDSRQILEIRRWWEEGDPSYVRKEVFVEYVFVPAYPGFNLGLLHILGNATRALTAAWRIALDNGMLANFPGGVMARSTGKQQTTNIRVGPGQIAPMDVDGVPLNQAFMPLPYRDVTQGLIGIIQNVEQTSRTVGGTAETAVGEGRNDAPVGTTIALIEQSQKVISAVHKRLHAAQQKEFALLKELFRRDPESLWRNNKNPNFGRDTALLLAALDNTDIVPKADPNTASHTMRVQKAIAIYTLAQQNPAAFDQQAVYNKVLTMVGIDDFQGLFSKTPPGPPPVDETKKLAAQAQMVTAQAKILDASVRAQQAQGEQGVKMAGIQSKNMEVLNKHQTSKAKATAEMVQAAGKIKAEKMRLDQSEIVHGDKMQKEKLFKGLDLAQAQRNKEHEAGQSSQQQSHDFGMANLDILSQLRKDQMNAAKEQNKAAQQHLHDVSIENQRAKNALDAQFLAPDEGIE
jgi:hypothetical protein